MSKGPTFEDNNVLRFSNGLTMKAKITTSEKKKPFYYMLKMTLNA